MAESLAVLERSAARLTLVGEAGIGKTTVLRALADLQDPAFRVVSLTASQVEYQVGLAVAADVVKQLDECIPDLAEPVRRVLAEVFGFPPAPGYPTEARIVGAAMSALLRVAAAGGGLLIVIDDLQWVDEMSVILLTYALRRQDGADVRVLAATRPGSDRLVPDATILTVTPLDVPAIRALVTARLGRVLSLPVAETVHGAVGGNPLHALETIRFLPDDATPEDVRLPPALVDLVEQRLAALPEGSRRCLVDVAVRGSESWVKLPEPDLLDAAFAAGILELRRGRVEFTHPLLLRGVLDAAAPLALQRAHQAAANDADDDLSRAHHLSRAGGGANEERAALLERASDIALARDDVLSGQLLAQAAVDATPQREGHEAPWSRWAALARAQARGGGVQDPVIGALTRTATTPDHHAMSLLYTAEGRLDDINDVVRLSQQAASYPGVSTAVRARALTLLAHHMLFRGARLDEAFRVATDAATTASEVAEHQPTPVESEQHDLARPGDELELAKSLTLASYVGRLAGVPCDPTMLERAEILQGNHALFGPDAVSVHGFLSVLDDDHDGARRELTRAKRQTGGLSHIPGLYLAELECRVGHLGAARHLIEESDAPALRASMVFVLAMVAAWEGDRELCFQWVLRGNELCQITRDTIHPHGFRTASALLELGSGDAEAAWHTATSTSDALETIAFAEPSVFPVLPVAIEASAMTGRVAEAERLVTRLERQAAALESRWAAACALRGRALIAGTLGDVEAGMALAGLSVEKFDELGLPTEAGRSALAAGHLARRAGQRIASRTWLQGAIDRLEPHGVAGFTAQARAELARVSGRSAGGNLLTPSELQVAEIAASGASNAQISASLFLSVKTVETHLSRIYRKLGVRSRAELASRWETLRPDVAGRPGH